MHLIGSSIVFGLPGLLLGLALGVVIRHWAALALMVVVGAIALRVRKSIRWFGERLGPGSRP